MSTVNTSAPAKRSARDRVQGFGRFLSSMVMPNIGAFIAWGLLTALFIPTGWFPNSTLATMVDPMIKYLLPLLIAYTGGKVVHDHRGGVLGAIAAMGVIVGAEIPMFIGAMIMGPLGGWVIKQFDRAIEGKIKAGFEMLVNNFSAGIIGMLLAILGYVGIGPLVQGFTHLIEAGVNFLVAHDLLPLVSLFVEPGKILFLNNAINHGIFTPLGAQQSLETGKSIFYLLEANPGPGLGVLLAYWLFGKGSIKASAPGAIIIQFFGGIHEIYFPYVLMKPILFVSVILGGMAGVFVNSILGSGLTSAASPGSIIAILALAPKGGILQVIAGVAAAALVSFSLSAFFLRRSPVNEGDLEKAQAASKSMKSTGGATPALALTTASDLQTGNVRKIVFACDAGMGSSAMGASSFRKKVQQAGLPIQVTNSAVDSIPGDADIVVTQQNLTSRARGKAPNAQHVSIDNFINNPIYDDMIQKLKDATSGNAASSVPKEAAGVREEVSEVLSHNAPHIVADTQEGASATTGTGVLRKENIVLGLASEPKEEAIRRAGELLAASGYVKPDYVAAMHEREKVATTYIGNGVAIPHGVGEAKKQIQTSGIVVLQYPQGVDFEGGKAYLVIGIAGAGGEHLQILTKIAETIEDESVVQHLAKVTDADEIYRTFSI
ncbi:PTS mannitol transporter subunit IICBA [Paenibacillus hunanensis]|uniref:PTS mannitol transporter subunit IICBA n=1 Tax=Paenibacillus hunanensis TaxID=539262 RepID=UPI002026FFC3|nr:PTS mannitol transporter subunit IICBA [Paenibacillus hunanensis]MCL9660874.1 PTS mannitol transporter subunit IICBA [Paenibacillus hunanensis]